MGILNDLDEEIKKTIEVPATVSIRVMPCLKCEGEYRYIGPGILFGNIHQCFLCGDRQEFNLKYPLNVFTRKEPVDD